MSPGLKPNPVSEQHQTITTTYNAQHTEATAQAARHATGSPSAGLASATRGPLSSVLSKNGSGYLYCRKKNQDPAYPVEFVALAYPAGSGLAKLNTDAGFSPENRTRLGGSP